MNETYLPSDDRLSAPSDLEEKLVFSSSLGTGMTPCGKPDGVIWLRYSLDVTPKLASTVSLLNTYG
jgi:hypothetical protein